MLLKRILLYLLVAGCTIWLVLISTWINISSKALTPWISTQLNDYLPKRYQAEIEVAETHFLGLTTGQIQIDDLATQMPVLTIQSIEISINYFSLIVFQEIDYKVRLYQGKIEGKMDLFPRRLTRFSLSEIQINRNAAIRKTNLLLSNPVIKGKGTFLIETTPEGKLDLAIQQVLLSGDPSHTDIPFELPDTQLSMIEGEFIFKGTDTTVRLLTKGDLSMNISGTVNIDQSSPVKSQLDLAINGTISPDYETKLGVFKSLLVNYKNQNGDISVNISGNPRRPRIKKI